jgi:hypothetical protein
MTRFDHVKEILDRSVNWEAIGGPHGAFWRNQTRNQFVQARIVGLPLIALGQPAQSNLIKAVRGIAPFGMDIGTAGAFYPRMPARRPPLAEADIVFLETWIADRCPEDVWPPTPRGAAPQGPITDQQINDYFRALDNWSLFQATPEVQNAVGTFFNTMGTWFGMARGQVNENEWASGLAAPEVKAALDLLGQGQEDIVQQFFGNPPRIGDLIVAYERFGEASLPRDPMRPDRDHRMDGEVMWFFWLGFADAARKLGRDGTFWETFTRGVLLGMMHDGLFLQRFTVRGFSADSAGREAMRAYVQSLTREQLITEGRTRFVESGLG